MTWMVPACQCLHAGDLTIAEADLGLKIRSNFAVVESGVKVLCDVKMVLGFGWAAGRLGGVTVDARMAAARSKSAVTVAHRTAAQRPASGTKTRAKIVVIAMPQSAPSGHNRPLYTLPAVGFAKKSRVVLAVVRTVSGQIVRIGLIGGRISLVARLKRQADEIKQLAIKQMGGAGIGQGAKQHIAPSGMIGLPAI